MASAAQKHQRVLLFGMQRRFGGCEQAARQAVAKQLLGEVYHVRSAWMRTRAVPSGTGWYTLREKSGGGAMADLGFHMLDLGWNLLGDPAPLSVMASGHQVLNPAEAGKFDVEESGTALLRFAGGKTLELAASWAICEPRLPPPTSCRGTAARITSEAEPLIGSRRVVKPPGEGIKPYLIPDCRRVR